MISFFVKIIFIFTISFFLKLQNTQSFVPLNDYYSFNLKKKTMKAIAIVESDDGKNINHKILSDFSFAIGKYALMPNTIRFVIKKEKALKEYFFLIDYSNIELYRYFKKNPFVLEKIANFYYDIIVGKIKTQDPAYVGYAWLNGIEKTKKNINKNISNHWHVKKILKAYYLQY